MSKKNRVRIEKNLSKVLLEGEPFSFPLFEYELKENLDFYVSSRIEDQDKYFMAITENTDDVAMILVNEKNQVLVNKIARQELQNYWGKSYENNFNKLIPQIARSLDLDLIYITGIIESNSIEYLRTLN
jgi:hypothetical protein